jgi:hypothetical protein
MVFRLLSTPSCIIVGTVSLLLANQKTPLQNTEQLIYNGVEIERGLKLEIRVYQILLTLVSGPT